MPRPLYILLHAVAAAAFGFVLQRYGLQQSVETARFWGAALGIGAGLLAWKQSQS